MSHDIKKHLNLQGVSCPMNFVRTKLALEEMETGELLEVILDEGDAMLNVPRSVKEEGHTIVKVTPNGEVYQVLIKKGA